MQTYSDKALRKSFLQAAYDAALEYSKSNPHSVYINRTEFAKSLGIDNDTAIRILNWLFKRQYISSPLGGKIFCVTVNGLSFLEEESVASVATNTTNNYTVNNTNHGEGSISSQIQQNVTEGTQHLDARKEGVSLETVSEFLSILQAEVSEKLDEENEEVKDLQLNIDYAKREISKGRLPKEQLFNIGQTIGAVGTSVLANIIAHPITAQIAPLLGF